MKAVDNALMITGDQAPEWTCSAVWGGKLLRTGETILGNPVIWKGSAVWGGRALSVSNMTEPCADLRMWAVWGINSGSTARGAN